MNVAQKRRAARIPVACPVGIRDKSSIWMTQTVDVGARGCRISLERPLARGSLVQVVFDRGNGRLLEAVGQVAWTCSFAPRAAGIVFVNPPREPSGSHARNWIDGLVAARLREVLNAWPRGHGGLAALADVVLNLGIPPTDPLDDPEVRAVRIARDGARLGAFTHSADALAVVASLLEREILSVARETPDPEGWKSAFARLARSSVPRPR